MCAPQQSRRWCSWYRGAAGGMYMAFVLTVLGAWVGGWVGEGRGGWLSKASAAGWRERERTCRDEMETPRGVLRLFDGLGPPGCTMMSRCFRRCTVARAKVRGANKDCRQPLGSGPALMGGERRHPWVLLSSRFWGGGGSKACRASISCIRQGSRTRRARRGGRGGGWIGTCFQDGFGGRSKGRGGMMGGGLTLIAPLGRVPAASGWYCGQDLAVLPVRAGKGQG